MPDNRDFRRDSDRRRKDWVRINYQIKVPEVRVIDDEGKPLGVLPTRDALKMAQEKDLDLVEVAPNAVPPVCRIIDFGKFKYERKQREKSAKKKSAKSTLKELKFRPKIGAHDIMVRVTHAQRFLQKGFRVRLVVRFRGREHTHPEIAEVLLEKVFEKLSDLAVKESPRPRTEGATMILTIAPKQVKISTLKKARGSEKAEQTVVIAQPEEPVQIEEKDVVKTESDIEPIVDAELTAEEVEEIEDEEEWRKLRREQKKLKTE